MTDHAYEQQVLRWERQGWKRERCFDVLWDWDGERLRERRGLLRAKGMRQLLGQRRLLGHPKGTPRRLSRRAVLLNTEGCRHGDEDARP